jgi:hypothetical protein
MTEKLREEIHHLKDYQPPNKKVTELRRFSIKKWKELYEKNKTKKK